MINIIRLHEYLSELNAIEGIPQAKDEILHLINNIYQSKQIAIPNIALVGDGETVYRKGDTLAVLIGKILNCLEVLPKDTVAEVSRIKLVGSYVGQTAVKTESVVNNAVGGILHIQEPYALNMGDNDIFGRESLHTLLQAMECHRNEMMFVFSGEEEKMKAFLNQNVGLRSRIPVIINLK